MTLVQPLFQFNWNFLFAILTFIALFFILKHFFFEKVHDFMVQREQAVQDTLDNADRTSREADEKLRDYEERIANVESEGRDIIKSARDEAKVQAKSIMDDANEKARQMIEHSETEIKREEFNARKNLRDQVGDLAVLAAQQIIEKELKPEDHEEIVNKIIEEADDKPWN